MSRTQVWSQIPRRYWQTQSFLAYAAAGMVQQGRGLPAAVTQGSRHDASDRQRAFAPGALAVAVADRAQADAGARRAGDAVVVRAPPEGRRPRRLPGDRPRPRVRAHALGAAEPGRERDRRRGGGDDVVVEPRRSGAQLAGDPRALVRAGRP